MPTWTKRLFGLFGGGGATQYTPVSGRIVAAPGFGPQTISGVTVTEATALTIPAFTHAVRLYGQIIGQQPFNVVELLDRGTRIAREHPVHFLLNREPNEFQTAHGFRETVTAHAVTYGNGYAYIERNGNFRPTSMIPLLPDRTYPVREGGRFYFKTIVNGAAIELDPYEVLHLPGFGFDGLQGLPLVRLMKDTLGLSKAEELYAAAIFGNGARPGGVVEVAGQLTDTARKNLKQSMADNHGGLGNAFKTLFLEEGMKFTPISTAPNEAQMVEARSYQLGDLARVVGLPPHLIYDLSRATFSNIEHLGIEAVTYSFRPWANRWEQEANRKLLYESEKGSLECRLDLSSLHAGDATSQANVDKADFDMCALTPNERRAKQGRNPIDGGDEPFLNTAYLPLSIAIKKALESGTTTPGAIADAVASADTTDADAAQEEEAENDLDNPEPPSDASSGIADSDGEPGPSVPAEIVEDSQSRSLEPLRPIVEATLARLATRDAKAVGNAERKHGNDEQALAAWRDNYATETRAIVIDSLAPIAQAIAAMSGKASGHDEIAAELEAVAHQYVASIGQQGQAAQITNQLLGGTE